MQITAEQALKLRYLQKLAGISLAAFLISIFFFSPHFAMWKGLHIDVSPAKNTAEVNRAQQVIRQLKDPFIRNIDDLKSNRPILWRLFFPIVAHYLFFPEWLFLSLPHLGCLFALGYVAHLTYREKRNWWWTLFAAVIAGTCTWFFVATGWLTYNDSWYMLGTLMITFTRSRIALAVICLIEPFIDERFVLGLPLGFVLRIIYFDLLDREKRRDLILDFTVLASFTLPYVLIRLGALIFGHDTASHGYLADEIVAVRKVALSRYLYGWWMGLRAGWVLVAALMWLVIRRKNWLINSLLIGVVIVTIFVELVVAADIGRDMSALFPAALLGLILLMRQRPTWLKYGLPIVMAANLALPAEHVITLFNDPIFYLYSELQRVKDPPVFLTPQAYVTEGSRLAGLAQHKEAVHMYNVATQLEPGNVPALLNRALAYAELNDMPAAERDADTVLMRFPKMPDALYVRGVLYLRSRDGASARRVFEQALELAPESWPQRANVENVLRQLSQ